MDALGKPLIDALPAAFHAARTRRCGRGSRESGAAFLRYQQAMQGIALQANAIATECRRSASPRRSHDRGPRRRPITTLRELHALWIDCGEAAWAAAAHREEFAAAQAELLAAFVELRAGLASP